MKTLFEKPVISLWKYNKITGVWNYQRTCLVETSQQWLGIFQKDVPGETFKLSKYAPKGRP